MLNNIVGNIEQCWQGNIVQCCFQQPEQVARFLPHTAKIAQGCSELLKTALNNVMVATLFNFVTIIVQHKQCDRIG